MWKTDNWKNLNTSNYVVDAVGLGLLKKAKLVGVITHCNSEKVSAIAYVSNTHP